MTHPSTIKALKIFRTLALSFLVLPLVVLAGCCDVEEGTIVGHYCIDYVGCTHASEGTCTTECVAWKDIEIPYTYCK